MYAIRSYYDFYDKLKSVTQGYGSFDYEIIDFRETNLVKLDILINGERVDALSQLVHRDRAVDRARRACERLQDEIPRQMFKIAIQGAIGGNIIARKTISAFRKDVITSYSIHYTKLYDMIRPDGEIIFAAFF